MAVRVLWPEVQADLKACRHPEGRGVLGRKGGWGCAQGLRGRGGGVSPGRGDGSPLIPRTCGVVGVTAEAEVGEPLEDLREDDLI